MSTLLAYFGTFLLGGSLGALAMALLFMADEDKDFTGDQM